jgi:hypothetical protein
MHAGECGSTARVSRGKGLTRVIRGSLQRKSVAKGSWKQIRGEDLACKAFGVWGDGALFGSFLDKGVAMAIGEEERWTAATSTFTSSTRTPAMVASSP